MKKKKLRSLKSLHNAVWLECKRIIRSKYDTTHCFICQEEIFESKKCHTSHLFKKGSLPLQFKYDLRLLRNGCYTCNRPRHGNESWYMVRMIETEGWLYIQQLVNEIRSTPKDKLPVSEEREYLEQLLTKYKNML